MSKQLKTIFLALMAVLAIGAVTASAAQAEPTFTVEGVAAGTVEPIAETTLVTTVGTEYTPSLTLTVPGFFTITCTGLNVKKGTITNKTAKNAADSLSFTTCKVLGPKNESTFCLVKNVGGTNGTIATGSLTSTLVTIGTSTYDTVTPVGVTFVELKISECALEGTYKVTGTAATKVLSAGLNTYVELESNEAIAKAAGTRLFFGAREAYLDGKVDLHLVSDRNWGVDA